MRRTEAIAVLLDDSTKSGLKALSEADRVPMSALVRSLIEDFVRSREHEIARQSDPRQLLLPEIGAPRE